MLDRHHQWLEARSSAIDEWTDGSVVSVMNELTLLNRRLSICPIFFILSVIYMQTHAEANGMGRPGGLDGSAEGRGSRQVKGASLVMKQFLALLIKRFHHATRSHKDFLAQVPDLT